MRICAAVMALVALIAACGSAAPVTPTAPPTTTTTPPPSLAELDARAKAAMAPPGAFDAPGGKMAQSTPANDSDQGAEREVVNNVCRSHTLLVDSGTSIARSRVWSGEVTLFQRVHAMSDLQGSLLVRVVRAGGDNCALYRDASQVTANLPIAKPEGVDDLYAHCEANLDPELVPWSCQAFFAKGNLVSLVVASGHTEEAASAQLTSVVPIFAAPFAKA